MDVKLVAPGIIGLVLFIIIFNVYHIIKIRKRNNSYRRTDAVKAFHMNYQKDVKERTKENEEYTKFITRYNSSVDFIDKETFVKEATEQRESQRESIQNTNRKKKDLHNNFM